MPSNTSAALITGAVIQVKHTRFGYMIYCIHDEYVGRSLDLYGEFSPDESKVFDRFVKPGMSVIDVGANIGVHTDISPNWLDTREESWHSSHKDFCTNYYARIFCSMKF